MTRRTRATEIARARALWQVDKLTVDAVCRKLGRSRSWLYDRAAKGGWPSRPPPRRNAPDTAEDIPTAIDDRTLFGAAAEDVHFLRRRGFAVTRAESAGFFLVNGLLLSALELAARAERERRLLQPAPTAAVVRHNPRPSRPSIGAPTTTELAVRLARLERQLARLMARKKRARAGREAWPHPSP
jgi:hypothetical protein